MGSAPESAGSSIHCTKSSKSLKISDLESVYSDYGDAESVCWPQREDEFHDAPELIESCCDVEEHQDVAGSTNEVETTDKEHNATKEQPKGDVKKFHDPPEMRDSLDSIGASNTFENASSSSLKKKAPHDKKLRRPTSIFNEKLRSIREDDIGKKEPSILYLTSAKKGVSPTTKEKHDSAKRIPISQGKPTNYSGVLLELKERLNSSQRTPLSVSKKLLQSKTSAISTTIDENKKKNDVVSNLVQKKSLHVTFDKGQKENLISKSEEKSNRIHPPLSPNNQLKPGSAKTRLEQIKLIQQKIAVCRTSLQVDKSLNSIKNVEQKMDSCIVPTIKPPLFVKKLSSELTLKKKSEENVQKVHDDKQEEPETPTENINNEKCPVSENTNNVTNIIEIKGEKKIRFIIPEYSDSWINTDPMDDSNEEIVRLQTKLDMQLKSETSLRSENDTLREAIIRFQRKETDLRKEISSLTDTLSKLKECVKDMEKKMLEKDTTIAMLKSNVGKVQNLSEKIRAKDASIADLQSKLTVVKDDYTRVMKELEKRSSELNQELKEKESQKNIIAQLRKEKDSLESINIEVTRKMSDIEKEGAYNLKLLSEAKQQTADLKRDLEAKSKEISDLQDKLESTRPPSPNIVGLSEQLIEKDAIISELETLRDGVQQLNREVCGMLACLFAELGEQKPESEVEQMVSSGRTLALKQSLLGLVEARRSREADLAHEECRRVIFNLESRAAVLEAELEEARNYSESLASYLSAGQLWGEQPKPADRPLEGEETAAGARSGELVERQAGDARHFMSASHHELFVLLEGKRQDLVRMERRVQELEEVHAACSQKRVRNEMRIDQLEMALAAVNFH